MSVAVLPAESMPVQPLAAVYRYRDALIITALVGLQMVYFTGVVGSDDLAYIDYAWRATQGIPVPQDNIFARFVHWRPTVCRPPHLEPLQHAAPVAAPCPRGAHRVAARHPRRMDRPFRRRKRPGEQGRSSSRRPPQARRLDAPRPIAGEFAAIPPDRPPRAPFGPAEADLVQCYRSANPHGAGSGGRALCGPVIRAGRAILTETRRSTPNLAEQAVVSLSRVSSPLCS